mmetsp:Transcript_3625/g.4264  ORF Transcript_3625/g.4264 Transcript_3625/m.4264 type:complete len:107 (+) Transcript_3625:965-1285(+)
MIALSAFLNRIITGIFNGVTAIIIDIAITVAVNIMTCYLTATKIHLVFLFDDLAGFALKLGSWSSTCHVEVDGSYCRVLFIVVLSSSDGKGNDERQQIMSYCEGTH